MTMTEEAAGKWRAAITAESSIDRLHFLVSQGNFARDRRGGTGGIAQDVQ